MSQSRFRGTPEELGQTPRSRLPARVWLVGALAVVGAFAGGAGFFFNLGAGWAEKCAAREDERAAPTRDAESEATAAQKRLTGRLLVDQAMYARHWEGLEQNEKFRPVVEDLVKRLRTHECTWRCISPYVTDGPDAPRDEFERGLVARFRQERPLQKQPAPFAERHTDTPPAYEYYQASYAEKSCLLCHVARRFDLNQGNDAAIGPPLEEGDLIAVVQVVVPDRRGSEE